MKKELIDLLEKERERKFSFEDVDKKRLLNDLLDNIGDLDSNNRDRLVYPCLAHLLHDKHFSNEVLIEVTEELISDKYLTFDMDNEKAFSVLKRSFTLLQLVILVYVHVRDELFSKALFDKLFNIFIVYFKEEKILTGYKEEVGWMHSIAHSADLFAQIFRAKELTKEQAELAMKTIKNKMIITDYSYHSDEGERMTTAIFNLLERDLLSKEFLLGWINDFDQYKKPEKYPEVYYLKNNRKYLLSALYFRLIDKEKYIFLIEPLKTKIIETESIR